jgi:hypothetical protein
MIKLAYLLGYSKVAMDLPSEADLKALKWGSTLLKALDTGGDFLRANKAVAVRATDLGLDAVDAKYEYTRAERSGLLEDPKDVRKRELDKGAEFQPMDMPPAGEPDYIEDVPEIPPTSGTVNDPKYAKRQAPANQKGTQYE